MLLHRGVKMSITGFSKLALAASLLVSATASAGTFHVGHSYVNVYGQNSMTRIEAVNSMIKTNHSTSEYHKLLVVNDYYNNNYNYVPDDKLWGRNDYWSTTQEFVGAHGGDCEDFAIAKYQTLVKMGVSANKLRLVYVNALQINQAHMILAYYKTKGSVPLVLDSLRTNILPATERQDLEPVYSFNAKSLWIANYKHTHKDHYEGSSERLSAWVGVNQRTSYKKPLIHLS